MDFPPVVAKPSAFEKLNDDVLWCILECASPDDIRSVNLVCRSLRRLARPFLYRSIVVRDRHLHLSLELEYEELLRRYTRNLEIDSWLDWEKVACLIYRLQKLETLKWNLPNIPVAIPVLESLQRWPNATLEIHHLLSSEIFPASRLTRLIGCSNLKSIKVGLNLTWGRTIYPLLGELKDVLVSCRALRRLELSFNSYSLAPARDARCLTFAEGEQLPPLEELVLDNYYWRKEHKDDKDPGAAWDWSRLRRLTLRTIYHYHFFQSVQGKISYLDYLEIEGISRGQAGKALNDFLRTITGLKELVMNSGAAELDMTALAHHGSTLTNLTLRGWLDQDSSTVAKYASEDYLYQLNESCPLLQDLKIEIIQTTWLEASAQNIPISEAISKLLVTKVKKNLLYPLAQFRNLHTLTFYFEKILPDKQPQARRWIVDNQDTFRNVFDYMAERKDGLPLRRLSLVFHHKILGGLGEPPVLCVKILTCTPGESRGDLAVRVRETKESSAARIDSNYSAFLKRWRPA